MNRRFQMIFVVTIIYKTDGAVVVKRGDAEDVHGAIDYKDFGKKQKLRV